MAKKIDWSLINTDTDREKLRKQLSMGDIMQEFTRLLQFYFNKRILILQHLTRQRRTRTDLTPSLFNSYIIEGTNIIKMHGYSQGKGRHSRKKTMSIQQFLAIKHKKEEILEGIKVLKDYEPFFKLLEGKTTAQIITQINNATLRREALNYYGLEKFFKEMNAHVVHQDGKQQLLTLKWHKNEEPIAMVKVIDNTTKDVYLLRVPPDMQTVKQAVAWTFSIKPSDYHPIKET